MRDKRIDLLRFIALSSLILAHIDGPGWLMQLNNFNVPLIVIASAMALTRSAKTGRYWPYVVKRLKRLVFPVWLFLTFYFAFLAITGLAPHDLTALHIWDSYTFTNAGGFMWIIRVFVLVALLTPLLVRLDQMTVSNQKYLAVISLGFILYEGFLWLVDRSSPGIANYLMDSFMCYAVGYGLIFAIGLRLERMRAGELCFIAGASLVVFGLLGQMHYLQEGHFVATQHYKYPPSAYYISYAIAASIAIWCLSGYLLGFLTWVPRLGSVVLFVAQNSLWVYFWHTIFLFIAYRMHGQAFWVKYFMVFGLSALTVYIQVGIVDKWVLNRVRDENVQKEIRGLLTG